MLAHQFFTLTARSAWSKLYDISDRAWGYLDRANDILKSKEARQTYRAIKSAFELFVVFSLATGEIARIAADGLVARSLEQESAPIPPVEEAVHNAVVVPDEDVVPDVVILEVQPVPPIAKKVAKKRKPRTAAKAKAGPSKGRTKAIKAADLV